jgi:hypothetical protein
VGMVRQVCNPLFKLFNGCNGVAEGAGRGEELGAKTPPPALKLRWYIRNLNHAGVYKNHIQYTVLHVANTAYIYCYSHTFIYIYIHKYLKGQ